jgi:hypothetical protein
MLEFYSSSNAVVNTKRAVAECVENALGSDASDCDLIILHTTMGHDCKEMLAEFRRMCPGAEIVGCTGSGVIGTEGSCESMRALAIMAIRRPREEFAAAGMDTIAGIDPYVVGRQIAQELKNRCAGIRMILFFPASLDILPADRAIEGIESVFGPAVPIFGGCAQATVTNFNCLQFMADRIFEGGTVAIGLADPTLEPIMGANHGHKVIGDPLVVTRAEANRVYEIDGKQAWKALTERAGIPETVEPVSYQTAALWSIARQLPEELHEEYGSSHSLWVGVPLREVDGTLFAWTVCPVGTKLWLTQRKLFQRRN